MKGRLNMDDNHLLTRIAEMYYLENKTQSDIAKELNIHRTTISKSLKKARENGLVQININYDHNDTYKLEEDFKKMFNLQDILLVRTSKDMSPSDKEKIVGEAAANYFKKIVKNNQKIGFSWGRSLSSMVSSLIPYETENTLCVPMIGGPAGRLASKFHVNTITYEAAKKIGGKALLIDAPAITETIALKEALLENSFNQELISIWNSLDIAFFGIGSPNSATDVTWKQFYGTDFSFMENTGVSGDIVSHFYDSNGHPLNFDFEKRIIGISLNTLKKIPTRVGIAHTDDKADSILAALRGNYLTTLITTQETAELILNLDSKTKP